MWFMEQGCRRGSAGGPVIGPDLCDGWLKYPNSYQKGLSKATSCSTRKKARRGEQVQKEKFLWTSKRNFCNARRNLELAELTKGVREQLQGLLFQ